jgi:hypothetical protein
VDVHLKELRSNVHNKTDAKLVQLISGMLDNRSDPAGRLLNTMQLNTNRLTSRFWIRIDKVSTGDIAGVRVDLVPQVSLPRRVGIPWSILNHDQQACPVGIHCDNINRAVIPRFQTQSSVSPDGQPGRPPSFDPRRRRCSMKNTHVLS